MITLRVNGATEAVASGTTVGAYLARRKIDPAVTVVEINGSLVKKEDFLSTVLAESDSVEVLRFVGGG